MAAENLKKEESPLEIPIPIQIQAKNAVHGSTWQSSFIAPAGKRIAHGMRWNSEEKLLEV